MASKGPTRAQRQLLLALAQEGTELQWDFEDSDWFLINHKHQFTLTQAINPDDVRALLESEYIDTLTVIGDVCEITAAGREAIADGREVT